MATKLNVNLAPSGKNDLILQNPVMPASGTFSWGLEFAKHFDVTLLGAIVSKGVTILPRSGNSQPRAVETPGGMLNSIGLQNVGVEKIIKEFAPQWAKLDLPVIVNIAGDTEEEFIELAETLGDIDGIDALELNISCPNVDSGLEFGQDINGAASVTRAAVRHSEVPVIVKLTPNVSDTRSIAKACEAEGAAAICAINTVLGMAIDSATGKPVFQRGAGGLSGPAIKPIALRNVYEVSSAVQIPVIGCGGITNGMDAIEFLMAGATAIQVGTASFSNPTATLDILSELTKWFDENNIKDVSDIIGCAQQ